MVIFLMIIYTIILGFFFKIENPFVMLYSCYPFLFLNFFWIYRKKLDVAAICLVIALHLSNKIVSDYFNRPFMCIFGSLFYPYFFLFVTSSIKILILNSALCIGNYFYNFRAVNKIFEVTLTEEQSSEIFVSVYICLFLIISACIISISQKMMESNVWELAHENYQKSEKLTQDLLQAMETKDAFISMISHEIRNPLNSMKGSVEYLLQVTKEKQHLQILRNAKLSGEILLNFVNNVLDAAKFKSDKMEIVRTETDILDVIKKAFSINSEILLDKDLKLTAYVDEKLPLHLWLDPSRMLQILMNLISNAIKFTPKGGKIELYVSWVLAENDKDDLLTPFVKIKETSPVETSPTTPSRGTTCIESSFVLREMDSVDMMTFDKNLKMLSKHLNQPSEDAFFQNPWSIQKKNFNEFCLHNRKNSALQSSPKSFLKIQILDSGSGISENDLPRLFGMFEQAVQHSRSAYGGSGLGLYICKQLCQKMGGDIAVQSEIGKATTFVFYLPADKPEKITMNIERLARKQQQPRVLVVDDYPINRYLHSLLLQQQGVEVVTANDGKEAFEIYQKNSERPFSFIMMDIQMPVMDGFTSAKLIREWQANENKKQTGIYFVTGEYFSEEEVMKGFKNQGGGVDGGIKCLQKPIDKEVLQKIVNNFK